MAIQVYNDGDHPAGYIGIRVAVVVAGELKQKYYNFRTKDKKRFVSRAEEQRLLDDAKCQEKHWKAQAADYLYQYRLTHNHANTTPYHGLGFTGMTISITSDLDYKRLTHYPPKNGDFVYFAPVFRVSSGAGVKDQIFNIHKLGFKQAWKQALDCWALRYDIKPADKRRIARKRPDPEQFKALRRYMNKQGYNIPASVLRCVNQFS